MANKRNVVRDARNASSRPTGLYIGLGLAVLVGILALVYAAKKPKHPEQEAAAFAAAEAERLKNAGPPQPYVMGDTSSGVKIEEFADYECPSCGQFTTVTEPDVRERIVKAGLASYHYYDFPLPMHHNTQPASNAAACADEQGKFWEMHDKLYTRQDKWGMNEFGGDVVDNPKDVFKGFAGEVGLNVQQWEQCYDSRKYQARVDANYAEGIRRKVNSTPTFFINGKMVSGARSYDEIRAVVDSARAALGAGGTR